MTQRVLAEIVLCLGISAFAFPQAHETRAPKVMPRTSPAAHAVAPGLERIDDWEAVQQYREQRNFYSMSVSKWIHLPGNETKTVADAAAALGLKETDPDWAFAAATKVMRANPKDDLGFMAIDFCLTLMPEDAVQKACTDEAMSFLDHYYLSDPRLSRVLLRLARGAGGERGTAFLDKVIQRSERRNLRAEAGYWLVEERHNAGEDPKRSPDERAAARVKLKRVAQLIAHQYADVPMRGATAGELIKPYLFSLEHLSIGDVMPDAMFHRIDGSEDTLKNYRGKVVLLDFWATWCSPCIQNLREHVGPLKRELQNQPFEVITVSIDDSPKKVEAFMDKTMPLPFVNWYVGVNSPTYRNWGLNGVPHYYLLDKDGVIRANTGDVLALLNTARKLAQE